MGKGEEEDGVVPLRGRRLASALYSALTKRLQERLAEFGQTGDARGSS